MVTGGNCSHPNNFARHLPCSGEKYSGLPTGDLPIPSLSLLRACVKQCTPRISSLPNKVYASLHRDPRDVAISSCFHLRNKRELNLDACVRSMYLTIALWMKFRDLFFEADPLRQNTVKFSYEDMLHFPERETARIVAVLHLGPTSRAEQWRLLNMTSSKALQKIYIGKNPSSSKFRAYTLRSAGAKTYQDYNLTKEVTEWMDRVYTAMDFEPRIL